MVQQHISYGDHVNDPSADSRRDAFRKVESNFNDLYGKRADDTCNVVDFEGCDPRGADDSTAAIQRAAAWSTQISVATTERLPSSSAGR